MTDQEIGALIAVIGLLSQLAGAVLLVSLFAALLRSHPRPQPYFRQWTRGWAALVVALCGVGIQYAFPHLMAAEPLAPRAANLVYQSGKLLYVAYLLAGTLNFVRGSRSRLFMRWAVPAALAYALVSTALSGPFLNAVMVFQTPVLVAPFLVCASLLLRVSRSRATLGSRTTGVVFLGVAALWILYAVGFAVEGFQPWQPPHGPLVYLLMYNSFIDLILQMLLGYGMVVLLLEDVSRESEDARYQLALAHDRLKQLSLYDPLTGALNRRAYDEGAGLEPLGGRFGTALMLDMDNLKLVNDSGGHAAGDELLRRLVETLRRSVRPLDRVYRWGGDEFLLLFSAVLPQEVVPRVREALRAVPELEASVGAARFSGTEDLPAAIERADRAMYEEKARNRAGRVAAAASSERFAALRERGASPDVSERAEGRPPTG
ncbi:MAG TPA: diguanylate cyclase [Thermoanaerobaculia bacterium]|nr:diguanylate cyclase [Thermoanaerobaculia bacterium]